MRKAVAIIVAVGLLGAFAASPAAGAYPLRGVGRGPSQSFLQDLPSYGINRTLGAGQSFSRAGDFAPPPTSERAGGMGSRGVYISLRRPTWEGIDMVRPMPGPGLGPISMGRVRTIASLRFENRGRFARLRETTLALAERTRQTEQGSLAQAAAGFRQFMFPLPLVDRPDLGYGFFSRLDIVGGGAADPEAFLAPFTADVQQSLGEKRFLDIAEALMNRQKLPEGLTLDALYDSQLAALANYLFNNGRYEGAAEAWAVVAERDPSNGVAARGLGLSLLATRQLERASQTLRRSLTLAHGWPDKVALAGSNLRDVFPNQRDLADARDELAARLERQPDSADLALLTGFLQLFEGQWDEARVSLASIAAKDDAAKALLARLEAGAVAETVREPASDAVRDLAASMTGLEEPALSPEARAELITALRQGPATYKDYMRVGDFRFFMGEFTKAEESYRAAHKTSPDDAFALFALTHAAFANGEYTQAARYLQAALAIEPNWGLFEFRLKEFYGDPDEFQRHLTNLQRQVELRGSRAELKFLLAYIYYFSGRYADAAEELAHVLRLEPGFQAATHFLRLATLQS
jgi:tetratricopeptide (TPR) repeat protein